MSKAAARVAPRIACRSTAVDGRSRSAVAVLSTMASMSPAVIPARCIAQRDASAAIDAVVSPSAAMRRS
jgi:hypothetical protein